MSAPRINDAREFLNSLVETPIKLPFDPALLPALFDSMSDSSRSSMKELADLVSRSQGLAAKVLSIANSACYGLRTSIATLERAVQVLGILDLRSLVIMFSMSESIPAKVLPQEFPARSLWAHQLRTARTGWRIATSMSEQSPQTEGLPDPDSVYAAGLLHDLGKIILAYRSPQNWRNITELAGANSIGMAEAEDAYWGIDHGSIGGIVLKDWNLPDILTNMVSWHHHPHFAEHDKLAVRILAVANLLAKTTLERGGEIPQNILQILPEFSAMLTDMFDELVDMQENQNAEQFAGSI